MDICCLDGCPTMINHGKGGRGGAWLGCPHWWHALRTFIVPLSHQAALGMVHISLSPIHHIVSCFASREMIPQIPRDVPAPPVWIKYR